ncbi:MAG: FIST N-terminal domain-containing protein [Myxococcota bacterium]
MMRWRSALSRREEVPAALAEVLGQTADVGTPDLILLFTSGAHVGALDAFAEALGTTFADAHVLGAVAAGVVGAGREIEGETAVSVTMAHLPGVSLEPMVVHPEDGAWSVDRWRSAGRAERGLLTLADPYSIDLAVQLPQIAAAFPEVPIVGGLASPPPDHVGARLVVDGRLQPAGAVALGLSGDVRVSTCVAQGCRPLGAPQFVTRCEGNRIFELDGRPVIEVIQELHAQLDPVDQALLGRSLFLGVQMRDQTEYAQGDFLIRNVIGIAVDPAALVVAALPERFQVVQFHVRDERAAREDLEGVLAASPSSPEGALLVSCVGRGQGLFGEPDHDTTRFAERFGDVPLGGFFANGEVGPVQGLPYLHGYTSVFALFSAP